MNKIVSFFKREVMFTISLIAALLSFLITPPTGEMIVNLNWSTLSILFMLFAVLEGMKRENSLQAIINLISSIKGTFALSLSLILIIFFLSMFITNDVSLLTFVPITILILKTAEKERYLIPVIVLETIAANLGSMATPFGNPQNLFLYQRMGISGVDFALSMLPIVIASLLLLIASTVLLFKGRMHDQIILRPETGKDIGSKTMRMFYLCLFATVLLTVLGFFPLVKILLLVLLMLLFFDRSIFKKIDWPLMGTFLCFFIFSSSIAANEKIASLLAFVVRGNEFASGLILSQVVSNVPAAILLEPFTDNYKALLYGVDIGGLGTPVASLASLISIRCFTKEMPGKRGAFMKTFLLYNLVFLALLAALGFIVL